VVNILKFPYIAAERRWDSKGVFRPPHFPLT
jgi:hypothetical protein